MHKDDEAKKSHQQVWTFWLPRLVISFLAVALWWRAILGTTNRLPFNVTNCTLVACVPTPMVSATNAISLQPEERILIAEQPFLTRVLLINSNVPRGPGYELWIRRGDKRLPLIVHTVPARNADTLADRAFETFVLAFALLMLWRGQTPASRGLCVFGLTSVSRGLMAITLPPPWNLLVANLYPLIGGPVAFIGLYMTATALVRPNFGGLLKSGAFLAYLGTLVLLALSELLPELLILGKLNLPLSIMPFWMIGQISPIVFGAIAWAVPLIYLVLGYRHSKPDERLRIRWFIASLSLMLPLIALNVLLGSTRGFSATELYLLQMMKIAVSFAVFAILSYAALNQRLVAVRFVINRALVFAVLTAILIGALSLIESLIEQSIVSKDAGLALNLAVPLLLGLFINRIHRWGEDNVERFVFRKEYQARTTILTFLHDAGFISQPATLYERTAEIFATNAGGRYAAMFLICGSSYERVAASKKCQDLPSKVDIDDEAMVRLRATLAPVDLALLSSKLGTEGLALPLAMRGRLDGVLLCGPKAEGRYAQSEIDFLEKAAAGISACIVALRAELQDQLVNPTARSAAPADILPAQASRLAGS